MISVRKSITGICWWVLFGDRILQTTDTKWQAEEKAKEYRSVMGYLYARDN